MKKLRLSNGKFFRGEEEVPIEICNKEQIECYKNSIKAKEKLINGVEVDYSFDINYSFYIDCVCGCYFPIDGTINDANNIVDFRNDIYDIIDDDIMGYYRTVSCPKCGQTYYIKQSDNGDLKYFMSTEYNTDYDNLSDQLLQTEAKLD